MSGYCVICYDSLSATAQDISAVLCGHTFHHDCLTNWTAKSKTCPQCRLVITAKNVIPKLFYNANPDPHDDPEFLKIRNSELATQLRQRDECITTLQRTIEVQQAITCSLQNDIRARDESLRAERELLESLKLQLANHYRINKHTIDNLKAQLKETQKSLVQSEERQKCFEDVLYGNLETGKTCDVSHNDSSAELLEHCFNLDTNSNDSIQILNDSQLDVLKMPTINIADKDTNPQLADKEACDIYTAYQLSSMAENFQLLAAADQELDRLFGLTHKEIKVNTDDILNMKRDGCTSENAIIID